MLNENEIIANFTTEQNNDFFGIGDDTAVIYNSNQNALLITKDLLVEDVHFRLQHTTASKLAHQAIAVNLSDIAAQGGKPLYIIIGAAIPPKTNSQWIKEFCQALAAIAKQYGINIIGGDTTKSTDKLFISVTAIGEMKREQIKFRHQAQIGDLICITGNIGEAKGGLIALENNLDEQLFSSLIAAQQSPHPLICEGSWLGMQDYVHAMIDLSDGLYIDLQRILTASTCAAEINLEQLPISASLSLLAKKLNLDPVKLALEGGEDYQLLFTMSESNFMNAAEEFTDKFQKNIYAIGRVVAGSKLNFFSNGKLIRLELNPYSHFGEFS